MLNQNEINKQIWEICDNFKNKTEIKKNYIVYISALLYIRYYGSNIYNYNKLYDNRNNYYIGNIIDEEIEKIEQNENDIKLFSNIKFKNIKTFRDIGEENIITKTIEKIFILSNEETDKQSIAKAYEYILEQVVYRNDIIKEKGEFYTPNEIADLMSKLVVTSNGISVYDPICGSGNLLIRTLERYKIDIYGRVNNLDYYNILKTRLLLNKINNTNIVYGNEKFNKEFKANVIMFNPPFADKNWKENELLKNYTYKNIIPESAVGDYIYVIKMLENLEKYGKMAVVLPHGVLFRENEKRIREKLIEENLIESIIGLPENLFYNTRIPVIIMVFAKNREEENILFIDASQDYESDRKNNILTEEYQEKIIDVYNKKKQIENYSHIALKQEILKNNYDLTIKKYIKKSRKIEKVNREQLAQNVEKLKIEQQNLEENIKDVLEVLGYKDIGKNKNIENREININKNHTQERVNKSTGVDYFKLGQRIKNEREKRNISQEKLAEKMDVSVAFLSRIERGSSQINLRRLSQICQILEISEGEILS